MMLRRTIITITSSMYHTRMCSTQKKLHDRSTQDRKLAYNSHWVFLILIFGDCLLLGREARTLLDTVPERATQSSFCSSYVHTRQIESSVQESAIFCFILHSSGLGFGAHIPLMFISFGAYVRLFCVKATKLRTFLRAILHNI